MYLLVAPVAYDIPMLEEEEESPVPPNSPAMRVPKPSATKAPAIEFISTLFHSESLIF